ncbi:MAG: RloB domain-containing protein [Calditrichia bacterium]|jgi:hypothetical protein|nr:RloB domain-containing protein [Calditrichia bacterium]
MGRERREFKRPTFKREINQLCIIATEGQKTEIKYFYRLKNEYSLPRNRIYIEILPKLTPMSSPTSVLNMLNEFEKDYILREGDELWMVIDRDKQSWTSATISQVARQCYQKNYFLALSNPAFEVWLLLHLKDLTEYTADEIEELFQNRRISKHRTRLERELITICGSYNKNNPNLDHYFPYIRVAVQRGENLIKEPNERWPNYLGTHVCKLVRRILDQT